MIEIERLTLNVLANKVLVGVSLHFTDVRMEVFQGLWRREESASNVVIADSFLIASDDLLTGSCQKTSEEANEAGAAMKPYEQSPTTGVIRREAEDGVYSQDDAKNSEIGSCMRREPEKGCVDGAHFRNASELSKTRLLNR